jgi:hypothetical protein
MPEECAVPELEVLATEMVGDRPGKVGQVVCMVKLGYVDARKRVTNAV